MYIKALDRFEGNRIEKNNARKKSIEELKNNKIQLHGVMHDLVSTIQKDDFEKFKYLIQEEIFYEIISENYLENYYNKLKKHNNDLCMDLISAYDLKGVRGFVATLELGMRN